MARFPKINPTMLPEWEMLTKHFQEEQFSLRRLFEENTHRFEEFSVEYDDFLFDYSKNLITKETKKYLLDLVRACGLSQAIKAFFQGEKINETEERAVLHTALRSSSKTPIMVDGKDIRKDIHRVLEQMKNFTERVVSGEHKGFSGEIITDIVNIGIGGSDLGAMMAVHALKNYSTRLRIHFVSNVDGAHIEETLKYLEPKNTLFIIASKTFSTEETMTNAETAKYWFLNSEAKENDISKHFVAISTNKEKVQSFGISPDLMFEFWDWVGGRYSMWSAIGLSIMLGIGVENFEQMLRGAENIDNHFQTADFEENIPVLMALLGIWYRNFFGAETYAILPYSQFLDKLPEHLQQVDMESNGKYINRLGEKVAYKTGAVLWGRCGTNGQHAFYQLIHQGTALVPADFIGFVESNSSLEEHHQKLMANFFAQTEALAFGKNQEELENESLPENLIPHKIFEGNKPTNTLLFKKLTPYSLGQLVAIYEHKIFTQGIVWNIFSFDQFGVELGKNLAGKILKEIKERNPISTHDTSTRGLINYFINHKTK